MIPRAFLMPKRLNFTPTRLLRTPTKEAVVGANEQKESAQPPVTSWLGFGSLESHKGKRNAPVRDTRPPNNAGASQSATTDFFGIDDITNKDIAGTSTLSAVNSDKIHEIYKPLLTKRTVSGEIEKEEPTTYGFVRRDSDNAPKEHGQFEEEFTHRPHDVTMLKKTYCSDQISVPEKPLVTTEETYGPTHKISLVSPPKKFESVVEALTTFEDPVKGETNSRQLLDFDFKYSRISKTHVSEDSINTNSAIFETGTIQNIDQLLLEIMENQDDNAEEINFDLKKDMDEHEKLEREEGVGDREPFDIANEKIDFQFDKSIEESVSIKPTPKSVNSLDYLKAIKLDSSKAITQQLKSKVQVNSLYSARVKLDSKGYVDFRTQVPDYSKYTKSEIFNFLRSNVIYHNHDIVAINKPYGISCHGGNDSSVIDYSNLNYYLQDIANSLRAPKLHLAHRIDQSTTGVLILSTSKEKANFLNKLFASGEVRKLYWCVTKDLPDPPEGIIDIPIEEYKVDGKSRQGLRPQLLEELRHLTKREDNSRRAITEFKVISSYGSAALVEVRPKTGVKHQIRCHLGFGLRTPILGDHKYSHITKILPQKLPSDLLLRLNVRQAKARTIPMHLHAKSILLPRSNANGEDIHIKAPLPRFFARNLRALKLLNEKLSIQCV